MKTLCLGLLIALPVFADVGPKTAPPREKPPVPEVENIGNMDVQMEEDQIRGTEIEKHKQQEEQMRKDLDENEEEALRTQKDY